MNQMISSNYGAKGARSVLCLHVCNDIYIYKVKDRHNYVFR